MIAHGFSRGFCGNCGSEIICPHTPCYAICDNCSQKFNSCIQCGDIIYKTIFTEEQSARLKEILKDSKENQIVKM
jgi:hypothetical protein